MITGVHVLLYTADAEADRAFLRDVVGFRSVDAGEGWLIFTLPPAELGVHPAESPFTLQHADRALVGAVLYLMCDDLALTVGKLRAQGVRCPAVEEAAWGRFTTIPLPSGASLGLYQPTHPTAI